MIWMLPDQIQYEQDVESVVVVVDFVYTMIFHPFYPFIELNTREWWFFFFFFLFLSQMTRAYPHSLQYKWKKFLSLNP